MAVIRFLDVARNFVEEVALGSDVEGADHVRVIVIRAVRVVNMGILLGMSLQF